MNLPASATAKSQPGTRNANGTNCGGTPRPTTQHEVRAASHGLSRRKFIIGTAGAILTTTLAVYDMRGVAQATTLPPR